MCGNIRSAFWDILKTFLPRWKLDKCIRGNERSSYWLCSLIHLGRFREKFAAHFAESLNTDRSVRAALFFAALYHDVEKPATKSVDEAGRIRFFDHDVRGRRGGGKARTGIQFK